jgi:MFS family permease
MWDNAGFISFLTFAQDFFVVKGYEIAFASLLTSVVMVCAIFLSPLIGYLVTRFGNEEVYMIIGGVCLAFLIYLISMFPSPAIMWFIGVFATFVPPPIFSLPSKIVKPQYLGLAFGILTTSFNIGVLAGPYLTGLVIDLTGEYTASFYLMSFFALLQAFTIVILYFIKRK